MRREVWRARPCKFSSAIAQFEIALLQSELRALHETAADTLKNARLLRQTGAKMLAQKTQGKGRIQPAGPELLQCQSQDINQDICCKAKRP
ncbi:hypothetical protein K3552_08500 [Leisingera aquaemixtae]|uniref:hypothetical protein n=1 Tax=Leisingera aquaemixtae TaxID=1396826 RepID=UPI0021A7CC57|nr:hypothetical protein [Leisingera aquaemixtae]UWQ39030.1 hypothetical protein K3552_08500 [Leisingera aquaemixtae]